MIKKVILKTKYGETAHNIAQISLKYGVILAVSYLILTALNLYVLLFPQHAKLVLSVLVVGSIAIGYYLAKKHLTNKNAKQLNPQKVLSNREMEVFKQLLSTKSNLEISTDLFIEVSTLKSHINRIYKKMGVKTRTELRKRYFD